MNRDFAVEPDTVRLIDLKTGPCKEFNIIYGNTTNRVSNFTELAENTLEKTIDNKVKKDILPLALRKRKMYEQYLEKTNVQKVVNSQEKNVLDYVDSNKDALNVPIILRKRLLFKQQIQK